MFYFASVECVKGVCVSMKRKITSLFLLGAVTLSVVGCGNNEKNQAVAQYQEMGMTEEEAKEVADAVLAGDEDVLNADAVENQQQEKVELSFEPSQGILDADLSSGKVQFLDTEFQRGEYLTLDEFIAKYGSEYDFSDIDTESFSKGGNTLKVFPVKKIEVNSEGFFEVSDAVYNNLGSSNRFALYLVISKTSEDHVRLGDLPVLDISVCDPMKGIYSSAGCWYPGGFIYQEPTGYTYETIGEFENYLDSFGYVFVDENQWGHIELSPNEYAPYGSKSENDRVLFAMHNDKNLMGDCPVFCYIFEEDRNTGNIKLNFFTEDNVMFYAEQQGKVIQQ